MMSVLVSLLLTVRGCVRSRAALQLEVLALRHQLHVLERSRARRLRLTPADRLLWVWFSRVWSAWRGALVIVKPETVIAWHQRGVRLFWTWKSRRLGRPTVPPEVRTLIRTMSHANPLWGAPRIHGELVKLGIDVCQATVAKYMVRSRRPPSQTWRTFLANHVGPIVAADFFVVPTAPCRLLFVLVILAHERRRIVHVAVTCTPDRGVDCSTTARRVPVGRGPALFDQRSRPRIRRTERSLDPTACRSRMDEQPRNEYTGAFRRSTLLPGGNSPEDGSLGARQAARRETRAQWFRLDRAAPLGRDARGVPAREGHSLDSFQGDGDGSKAAGVGDRGTDALRIVRASPGHYRND